MRLLARRPRSWATIGCALAAAAVVVLLVIGLVWLTVGFPPYPDPGGRILAELKTVRSVIPDGSHITLRADSEPSPDGCTFSDHTGMSPISSITEFRPGMSASRVVQIMGARLEDMGWSQRGFTSAHPGYWVAWSRKASDKKPVTAILTTEIGHGRVISWSLDVESPSRANPLHCYGDKALTH